MKKCYYCGKKVFMGQDKVLGEGVTICACDDCFKEYLSKSDLEKAKAALEAGYLPESEDVYFEDYIEAEEAKLEEKKANDEAYRQAHTTGVCPKCGKRMIEHKRVNFVYNETADMLGAAFRLSNNGLAPTYRFVPHICEACGYTEFYAVDPMPRIQD